MQKNLGFTAFELAVTIAIMAILTTITLPPYMKWWRSSRLQSGLSNLTADIEMAKTRSIRENASVVIDFDTDGYIIFVDSNSDWNPNNGEDVLLNRALPAGVFIDVADLSFPTVADKLRFTGRGIPFQIVSNKEIHVNQAGNDRIITINRLGNINVQ